MGVRVSEEVEALIEQVRELEGRVEELERANEALAETITGLLPGEVDIYDKAAMNLLVDEIWQVLDDAEEMAKMVEPLLGSFHEDDTTETTTLRQIVYRLNDRLR